MSLWVSMVVGKCLWLKEKGVPSAESSRSVRGLGKGVSGKPYPRLCNARRPRLEPGTFRSQAGGRKLERPCMSEVKEKLDTRSSIIIQRI